MGQWDNNYIITDNTFVETLTGDGTDDGESNAICRIFNTGSNNGDGNVVVSTTNGFLVVSILV